MYVYLILDGFPGKGSDANLALAFFLLNIEKNNENSLHEYLVRQD